MLRAPVACGWFGIQTLDRRRSHSQNSRPLLSLPSPTVSRLPLLGSTGVQFGSFLFFWAITMAVVYKGIDSVRLLLNIKAPLQIVLGTPAAGVGLSKRRWLRPHSLPAIRVRCRPTEGRPVLEFLFPSTDRYDWFLGNTLAQHSGFFTLRAHAARSDRRAGARSAADHGTLFIHRGGGRLRLPRSFIDTTIWNPIDVLTRFKKIRLCSCWR